MKPVENQVYDHYPQLLAGLDQWGAQIDAFHVNDLAVVNARLRLTGKHVLNGVVTPLSRERLDAHSKLIMAAQAFRTARLELIRAVAAQAAEAQGQPDPQGGKDEQPPEPAGAPA